MIDDRRGAQLVAALGSVRARLADACIAVGRDTRDVTLVAVTKTYPASDVATLQELGVLDVGESRDQEAKGKVAELGSSAQAGVLRWHFVGRVQTNKAASIAGYAHAVHSIDRLDAVAAFAKAVVERATPLEAFVQVSLDGDPARAGAVGGEVLRVAEAVAAAPNLLLRGVMAVPPIAADPEAAFARLAEISASVRAEHPEAVAISGGMSADLEQAVRHGATHVRVGTALLGRREPTFS
ncbi:YggS family pyridoxal phosphate-dependent enzyme [Jatrophihabitans sp.]|uniref:YggS family pyridoxal phosphate-dependent enzyme n=1 Tax=Jatrophihabitans sp. TaxID=1932789 RepID=UPI0030C67236|nr:YggS family pyridoxal phosphate-dependent enzyme [Jatrophihabitans sp.]